MSIILHGEMKSGGKFRSIRGTHFVFEPEEFDELDKFVLDLKGWLDTATEYERQHRGVNNTQSAEYHRGAKEAFARVFGALLQKSLDEIGRLIPEPIDQYESTSEPRPETLRELIAEYLATTATQYETPEQQTLRHRITLRIYDKSMP